MKHLTKNDLIEIINIYQNHINEFVNVSHNDIDDMYAKLPERFVEKKKQNTGKKAFEWDNLWERNERLYHYIKETLFDDSVAVQKDGEIIVFTFNYSPQTAGTFTQRETYQRMKIEEYMGIIYDKLEGEEKKVHENLEL